MNSLREALRTQYIGAILIAMLGFQGLFNLLGALTSPLYLLIGGAGRDRSVLGSSRSIVNWNDLLPYLTRGILYLLVSYALVRWLYAAELERQPEPVAEEP